MLVGNGFEFSPLCVDFPKAVKRARFTAVQKLPSGPAIPRPHSRLEPQVRLGRLPTPSRDDAIASGRSPVARLAMTQTFTG